MSPAELDRLRQLRAQGLGYRACAVIMRMSRKTLMNAAVLNGISVPKGATWWTQERFATLVAMAADKRYARDIAERLGCTRNAVIGKARRMGVELNEARKPTTRVEDKTNPKPRHRLPAHIRPEVVPIVEIPREPTSRTWIRFVKMREWSCRWPVEGDPGPDMLCCGAKRVGDKPYCEHHCEIAYRGYE